MPNEKIHLPKRLDLANAIAFIQMISEKKGPKKYSIGFDLMRFVEPLPMLLTIAALKVFLGRNPGSEIIDFEGCTYPGHMGFFKALGIGYGKAPGEAAGSTAYLPITIVDVSEIVDEASAEHSPVGEILEGRATRLAELLLQQKKTNAVDIVAFSMREILRNVVEHSESKTFTYCAQYWPSKATVEIAILDTGIGIRKSLSENPAYQAKTDRDALHLSLLPGVSGKAIANARSARKSMDVWANSGFGLYMTSRLCRDGGDFLICSGSSGLSLSGAKKTDLRVNHVGTALKMTLRADNKRDLKADLQRYRDDGYAASKGLGKGSITASIASQMLLRDFKS